MKKLIIAIFLMLLTVGCSGSNYNKLNYENLTKKLENKDTFILLVNDGSDEAKLLKNTLNKVLEENKLTAYEINPNKITEDEKNELRNSFSYENISIIFFKDGIDPSKLSHVTDTSITKKDLEKHLTNLGFIKSE